MQVFETFMKILRRHILPAAIYIILFTLLGLNMINQGSQQATFKKVKQRITIADNDDSPESRAFVSVLEKNYNIVKISPEKDKLIDAIFYQDIDGAVIIHEDFGEKFSSGDTEHILSCYTDQSSFTGSYLRSEVSSLVNDANAFRIAGSSPEEAFSKAASYADSDTKVEMISEDKESAASDDMTFASNYFQFLAYIIFSVIMITLTPVLTNMTNKSIGSRTNCSMTKSSSILRQLIAGSLIFSLSVFVILIGLFFIIDSKDISAVQTGYGIINAFAILIFSVSFTLLVAVFSPSSGIITLLTNLLGLGMSFVCGVFVPLDLLSDRIKMISRLLPFYWYITANNKIYNLSGETFSRSSFFTCIMIEILFSAAVLSATLFIMKQKKSSKHM
ncbi:MAG: ABC transporter permease [Ruminococcus sp.]|nr:ABC transporter permease [Ruminococcus sp.]